MPVKYKYFYNFDADCGDEHTEDELNWYCKVLNSMDDLSARFEMLRIGYDTQSKERADIYVAVFPTLTGVLSLHVYHQLKRRLFARDVIKNCFVIYLEVEEANSIHRYEHETMSYKAVITMFYNFVVNHQSPSYSSWKSDY